ncbi:3-dehydroquinate dehydratase-1 [Arcanobacterium wilhelmae]|uniref:3-dehydroquinate dehydratase n=1 Tax=Arcanobacterium wilhelmae TaxID=1803177 RepID=A0ABT9NCF8_9ACTO|nr:type I 3-dehydroquinate dehydratase [Arcanobacterium wilhelmae]MDP9801076.1 3-dehydroquinate dehydratase-1 [Arcanobacterium wilhelmae]WFN90432.1 type I 3-dehydroquinate dehydratase [Arcanobacterium wilhelmae]
MEFGPRSIVVPLVGTTKAVVLEEIAEHRDVADVFEWRIDFMIASQRNPSMTALGHEIIPAMFAATDRPFLLTIRTLEEGGTVSLTDGRVRLLFAELFDVLMRLQVDPSRVVIDLEFSMPQVAEFVRRARAAGYTTMVSHHEGVDTPDNEVMQLMIEEMREVGADVVKFVVSARSEHDLERLYEVLDEVADPSQPIISYAQGPLGVSSRYDALTHGSVATFVPAGHPNQPRLISPEVLRQKVGAL